MIKDPRIDSALHVLKGSVQNVLGATVTTSVFEDAASEKPKGRLVVQIEKKPTEEEMKRVEEEANKKIAEDVAIESFEMDRDGAETEFGKAIYDRFEVPAHIRMLRIVRIHGWNINCCAGSHVATTGCIGQIRIEKYRFRNSRGELEISFILEA